MTTDALDRLRLRMEEAAAAMDFEEAQRLRDRISLLRAGSGGAEDGGAAGPDDAAPDTSRFTRQQPGAMGLGTSDPKPTAPPGWTPPPRPDPMTRGHKTPRRRR